MSNTNIIKAIAIFLTLIAISFIPEKGRMQFYVVFLIFLALCFIAEKSTSEEYLEDPKPVEAVKEDLTPQKRKRFKRLTDAEFSKLSTSDKQQYLFEKRMYEDGRKLLANSK